MKGFEKIDLQSEKRPRIENTADVDRKKHSLKIPTISSKKLFLFIGILAVGAVISFFTIVVPARKTYASYLKTYTQAKVAWTALKNQNVEQASKELEKTNKELLETQKNLNSFSYVRYIPIANGYYNDADHMIKAGLHGLNAASILVDAVKPYSDILGLKGKGSFVMGSAETRIQTAVLTMGKITPRIDEVAKSLELVQKELDQVNPNHYPSFIGGGRIKRQLQTSQNLTNQGVQFVKEAQPLIKLLPSLLGESTPKRYLILFQNDNELRPTGGFITAYAVFRIDKGIIHVERSSDIYNLDNTLTKRSKAPEPILKYLPRVTEFNLRDSNLSPDFIESMNTFNSIYKNSAEKVDVDGIIALDTHILVSTIKILDDEVYASGIRFTTTNDTHCDCPQVIYELERLVSTPKSLDLRVTSLAAVQAQRKDLLGSLLYSTMQKAFKSSPKLYWGPLVQDMVTEINQKHILIYLYDENAQKGIEALNAAGRIKAQEGDYLHINDSNFGGAKSNLFVQQSVTQDTQVSSDGKITKTVTINYKNPHPPSDCNLERGNLCLNSILRDWVRVYVPVGSQLIDSTGSEVKVTSYKELGKTVFEGFLTVRPQGTAQYTLKYTLPFKLEKGSPLPLLIQKQPGTDNNEYTVKLQDKVIEKFNLLTDKEITLNP